MIAIILLGLPAALLVLGVWGAWMAVSDHHECLKRLDEREREARRMGAVL